jgi:hypothetical protein
MIEIDGVQYPTETRASAAPPPRPDQELPAGATEPPGYSDLMDSGRTVVAGRVIETEEPGFRGRSEPMVGEGQRYLQASPDAPFMSHTRSGDHQDEINSGLEGFGGTGRPEPAFGAVPDPGSGQTYVNPNAPTMASEPPATPDEIEAARGMLRQAHDLYGGVRVLQFVRYPNDRRISVKFEEEAHPGEVRVLQRAY